MPIISRRVGSSKRYCSLANTQACYSFIQRSVSGRFVERLEQRVLLSGTAGTYDTSFGQGGYITGYSVLAVQSDGSLIAQQVNNQGQGGSLVLLHPDGSYEAPYTGSVPKGPANSPNVQSDGKHLVVNGTSVDQGNSVTRYNANGTVDTSFGNNGTVTDFISGTDYPAGAFNPQVVAVFNDRIIVGGTVMALDGFGPTDREAAIEHLNMDGSIDHTFGKNGVAINPDFSNDVQTNSLFLGPNGNYFAVGEIYDDPNLVEYDQKGNLIGEVQTIDGEPHIVGGLQFTSDRVFFLAQTANSFDTLYVTDLNLNPDVSITSSAGYGSGLITVIPPNHPQIYTEVDTMAPIGLAVDPNGRVFVSNYYSPADVRNNADPLGAYTIAYHFDSWTGRGSISGTFYTDANGNGIQDAGEQPIQGEVYVDLNGNGKQDPGEPIARTDSTGHYSIQGVPPGTYNVDGSASPNAGQTQSSTPAVRSVTVTANSDTSGINFGEREVVKVEGTVSEEVSSYSWWLAGWTVYLDGNNNGILDPGETSAVTDSKGEYSFPVPAGTPYRIREIAPPGWTVTTPSSQGSDGVFYVGVASGQSNLDFTNVPTYAITGSVFVDTNQDGQQQNTDETTLANITLYIDSNNNGTLDTGETSATTDANGHYIFANLSPGTYYIREANPQGWQFTTGDNGSLSVTLSSDDPIAQNQNFGQVRFSSDYIGVKGTVFNDQNGDGLKEPGDAGVSGFGLYLDLNNNGVYDSGEPVGVSGPDGSYSILDAFPGTYSLRETPRVGWKETSPAAQYYTVTISSNGASATEYNFGNIQVSPVVSSGNAQIVGSVFDDGNGNGKRQKHEKPLAGVQVYADLNGDGLFESNEPSATTDASGQYTIKGLGAGSVMVRAIPPAGWIATVPSGGLSAQLVTDSSTAKPAAIGLAPGASVTGSVLNDVKGKGHVNKKSTGLAGWRVFVDEDGDGVWQPNEPSEVTDATGSYTISGLSAGKVELRVVPQSAWKQTTPKNDAPLLMRLALKKKAKAKPIGLQQLA